MPESGYSLTLIFLYKDRIYASVLICENAGQRKPVFWSILNSVEMVQLGNGSFTATHAFFFFFFFLKNVSRQIAITNLRPIFTCSKLTVEIPEEYMKLAQN